MADYGDKNTDQRAEQGGNPIEETELQVPAVLAAKLKAQARPIPVLSAKVDRQIALAAKGHFNATADRQPWMRGAIAVAAAVTVAVSILLVQPLLNPERAPSMPLAEQPDLNGSGRFDIADVMLLARSQSATSAQLESYAAKLVKLPPTSS